jgi:hypothetical protein
MVWLVLDARADPPAAPTGAQTPCDWVLALRETDAPLPEQVELVAANADLFAHDDLKCLKKAGVHSSILAAAKNGPRVPPPPKYDIEFVAVVVGPAKSGGAKWDGIGQVPEQVVTDAIALATGGVGAAASEVTGVSAVATYLTNALGDTMDAPDVYGYAQLGGPGVPILLSSVALSLRPPTDAANNTYYANFPGSPAFTGIALQEGQSVRVTLYDRDPLDNDDLLGTFDLPYTELLQVADQPSGVGAVAVADRTNQQVLQLQIAVRPSSSPLASVRGQAFRR